VVLGRARGVDIRQHGSRNIGATNVGRVLGRRLGLLCLFLDALKGAGPVLAAGWAAGILGRRPYSADAAAMISTVDLWWWIAVAAATVLGHCASIYLRFKGGKGVATSFGAIAAMWNVLTFPALGALVVWYLARRVTGYVSVASMSAVASLPLFCAASVVPPSGANVGRALLHASPPLVATCALAALVIWRHRANIGRLRRGEEPKGPG
jgi:acyl phosphate:glycerol-3-phosphate acyltransferase